MENLKPYLIIQKNIVYLSKKDPNWIPFVKQFLVKYEDVLMPDRFSFGAKRSFKMEHVPRELYVVDNDYVKFSRGLLSIIPENSYIMYRNFRESIATPDITFDQIKHILPSFDLRDDQVIAVQKCLLARRGIIQMPTATGKSAVIASVLKILHSKNPNLKSLVIAPTLSTVENIKDTLEENGMDCSIFGHPSKDISSPITAALVQSLVKYYDSSYNNSFLKDIGLIIYDECHHLKCDTWNKLNLLLPNVEYALGFSALSIDRKEIYIRDIRNLSYEASKMIGSAGPVLFHMDPSYYIENKIIARPVVFRINNEIILPPTFDESEYHKVVKYGLMSTTRTILISKIIKIFNDRNRKILVLVSEKEHAFEIVKYLVKQGITNYGISFGAGVGYLYDSHTITENEDIEVIHKKENSLEVLNKLKDGSINVLIGSSHVDEGVNIPNLDATILAGGGKIARRIIQRLGRVLRKSKTGKYAYIIDFADKGSRVLNKHSKERLKLYKEFVKIPDELIFDNLSVNQLQNKFEELEEIST